MDRILNSLSIFEFQDKFPDEAACYAYLRELKWPNEEFTCRKCGHSNACKGNGKYNRKCTKCCTQESITAHTLFHKCKFSLLKAFWIIFYVSTTKNGISSMELSRKLDLRQKTCWLFKRKVMEAMKSSQSSPMSGDVDVDEFYLGGKEPGVKGRKSTKKRKVVIAIEKRGKGVSRIYAKEIKAASKAEILPFMRDHLSSQCQLSTDGWSAYKKIENEFPNHKTHKSNKGKNYPKLHRCIMMIKAWLRGTHHSVNHLQAYLDEYTYRFNRHLMKAGQFENLVLRMVKHKPVEYKIIRHA